MSSSNRTIIFDIFGVLLSSSFPSGAGKLSALLDLPAAAIKPVYVRWEYPWDRGRITVEEFWAGVQADLGTAVDWRLLNRAVLDSIRPLPDSLEMLDRCAGQANIYLLSDTRREWFEELDGRHDLRRRVRQAFLSYEMGFGKVEPRCFEHVLAELGAPAETVCLVDDRDENVAMAQRFGMRAIQFVDATQAQAELAAIWPEVLHSYPLRQD